MGFCSGTQIFDDVAEKVFDEALELTDHEQAEIINALIEALENHDWDCHQDSAYYDHPIVQKVMRQRNPEWFEDNISDDWKPF